MRILKISDELAKHYITVRDSYDSALQALIVPLPDLPAGDRPEFYRNAFGDLCTCAAELGIVEEEILDTLGINTFQRIEFNEVYTMEDEYDN